MSGESVTSCIVNKMIDPDIIFELDHKIGHCCYKKCRSHCNLLFVQ